LRDLSTMLRLNQAQQTALGDTLRELANLVVGALALGQFVGQEPPSIWMALAGIFAWWFLVAWGIFLTGDRTNG
jgi:hypothetical protein